MKAFLFSLLVFLALPSWASYSFVGIGATLDGKQKNGLYQIIDLIDTAPAAKAGVLIGEWVLAVDGESVKTMKIDDVVAKIRGPEGTAVTLTLLDRDQKVEREVRLTRELITIQCFIEGRISLSLRGDVKTGTLWGSMGNYNANLNVSMGRASGYVGGEYLSLQVESPMANQVRVSGWIRGQHRSWSGFNGSIYTYENCIQ